MSAFSSAPSSTASAVSQNQQRRTTTAPSDPSVALSAVIRFCIAADALRSATATAIASPTDRPPRGAETIDDIWSKAIWRASSGRMPPTDRSWRSTVAGSATSP
jgi:hypothetical protein